MKEKFLFVEKYAPSTLEECILPEDTKKTLSSYVESGKVQNFLFSGSAGVGKTSTAKAICKDIGCDFILINGSDQGRFLDTVRTTIRNFASTVSLFSEKKKVIIIDEADNTSNDVQLALRASIEEFQNNCAFILTANYKNKIIPPLHSRCSVIDFSIRGDEKIKIAGQYFKSVKNILKKENIPFEEKVIADLIRNYFPDFRRILNELQRYSSNGEINVGILSSFSDENISKLVQYMKSKQYSEVRKWVVENLDNDPNLIFRRIYDSLYNFLEPPSIPQVILVLAKYQYQQAFVADTEINLLACLTEIMVEASFK